MTYDPIYAVAREARKRGEQSFSPPLNDAAINLALPRQWAEEVEIEADRKGMSVNAFMRSMIRGYFGSACRP